MRRIPVVGQAIIVVALFSLAALFAVQLQRWGQAGDMPELVGGLVTMLALILAWGIGEAVTNQ